MTTEQRKRRLEDNATNIKAYRAEIAKRAATGGDTTVLRRTMEGFIREAAADTEALQRGNLTTAAVPSPQRGTVRPQPTVTQPPVTRELERMLDACNVELRSVQDRRAVLFMQGNRTEGRRYSAKRFYLVEAIRDLEDRIGAARRGESVTVPAVSPVERVRHGAYPGAGDYEQG